MSRLAARQSAAGSLRTMLNPRSCRPMAPQPPIPGKPQGSEVSPGFSTKFVLGLRGHGLAGYTGLGILRISLLPKATGLSRPAGDGDSTGLPSDKIWSAPGPPQSGRVDAGPQWF